MDDITCSGFTAEGGDAGVLATLKYNVDYQNAFVGGYVVLVLATCPVQWDVVLY